MTHAYANLGRKETLALAKGVLASITVVLPSSKDEDDRYYRYADPKTQRQFDISCTRGFLPDNTEGDRYYIAELYPTGVLQVWQGETLVSSTTDARIQAIEASAGPNRLVDGLEAAGIDYSQVVWTAAGFSIDSKYFRSLEECARKIVTALKTNRRHCSYRKPTKQEVVKRDRQAAQSSYEYWQGRKKAAESAKICEAGIFKGCHSMMGPLSADTKKLVLAYLNNPTQNAWGNIRGYCIIGGTTLWQAWCRNDALAPRSGSIGFPDKETLLAAIRTGVEAEDALIAEKLRDLTPSGLKRVA